MQLHGIREQIEVNRFLLSVKKWIELTNAAGIRSSTGRYGGTFAHPDIAFHFCLWLSPTFQLYVSKEFQRLKAEESTREQEKLGWNLRRELSKINDRIHADAVQKHLIPPRLFGSKMQGIAFSSEADLLNVALFGMTAREFQVQNLDARGNLRDHATAAQLLVLANLESLNAHLIKEGFAQDERLEKLNAAAIYQMALLADTQPFSGFLDPKAA